MPGGPYRFLVLKLPFTIGPARMFPYVAPVPRACYLAPVSRSYRITHASLATQGPFGSRHSLERERGRPVAWKMCQAFNHVAHNVDVGEAIRTCFPSP